MGKNVCGGCNLIFASLGSFDKHFTGDYQKIEYGTNNKPTGRIIPSTRRCLTILELQAKGMVQNDQGWWHQTLPDATRERFERLKQEAESRM